MLHEEFDHAAWLADAGVCALRLGQVQLAVVRLQQASNETPQRWVARHVFAKLALAGALVVTRDRDAALAVAEDLLPRLAAIRSRELTDHFLGFLGEHVVPAFPGDGRCLALAGEAKRVLALDTWG